MSEHATKRKPVFGSFSILLVGLLSWTAQGQELDNRKALMQNIKVGEAVRLSALIKRPMDAVCVLYPYQPSLNEQDPLSLKINAHLSATHYSADEGHWALIIVEGDRVLVEKFKRSDELDIRSGSDSTPPGFKPGRCIPAAQAAFAKVQMSNRNYLVLGETK
jgi:hypothetical protein